MQTDAEVAAIAAGLTKAQRQVFRVAQIIQKMPHSAYDRTARAMERKGLMTFQHIIGTHGRWSFTDLGLRVAQHLKQENSNVR